ncbi:hypothetical protein [Methylomonas fluvii]|uniref:DUF4145 domain-containing protein n=1 Tax=Methylomonas fluvii TaxID=1854564 RepID=A0ABR9DFG2_9GAMM|nr:hypothetical protein [Methylomonas fluvii]MBD9361827.1 hypothetical protein [Methylomonas fluvii]
MQEFAVLLQALAALLWPVFAFTTLFVFKKQLANLLTRLKKGKLLGQEIELNESLEKLQQAAQDAQVEVAALPQPSPPPKSEAESIQDQNIAQRIIGEAAISPKAALISLAAELERLAREVLATTGHLRGRRFVPIQQAIAEVHQSYGLAAHVPSSLHHFWDVRNRLIHKNEGTNEDILRAIDSGISILRALQAMPREVNVVHDPNVPVFSDQALTTPITNVHGVLLETHSAGGVSKTFRIYPSSQSHFAKGKQVSWEWNMSLVVGQAWYRDPTTGESKEAWSSSAEFIGRHLDEL